MLCAAAAADVPGGSCAAADPRLRLPAEPGMPAGEFITPVGPPGGVRIALGDGRSDGSIADVSGLPAVSGALALLRGWPGKFRIIEKPSCSALRFGREFMR